jgi:hypothetical protein
VSHARHPPRNEPHTNQAAAGERRSYQDALGYSRTCCALGPRTPLLPANFPEGMGILAAYDVEQKGTNVTLAVDRADSPNTPVAMRNPGTGVDVLAGSRKVAAVTPRLATDEGANFGFVRHTIGAFDLSGPPACTSLTPFPWSVVDEAVHWFLRDHRLSHSTIAGKGPPLPWPR